MLDVYLYLFGVGFCMGFNAMHIMKLALYLIVEKQLFGSGVW